MASRKKIDKRERQRKERLRKRRRLTQGLGENTMLISTPPGELKMSEVLEEFIEPFEEFRQTEEQLDKLLSVAVIAWNTALLPAGEREGFIEKTLQSVPAEAREDLRSILLDLIRRKLALFVDVQRSILNYELISAPSGPRLNVISTLTPLGGDNRSSINPG
jgi:hypothetical protein